MLAAIRARSTATHETEPPSCADATPGRSMQLVIMPSANVRRIIDTVGRPPNANADHCRFVRTRRDRFCSLFLDGCMSTLGWTAASRCVGLYLLHTHAR